MIILELPYPPSINSYYGRTRSGQVFIKEKGKEYRKYVVENFTVLSEKTLLDKISLKIHLYPPDKRKRDLDNVLKSLLDSLTHACVYEDDSLIDELTISRKEQFKGGKCIIFIEKL